MHLPPLRSPLRLVVLDLDGVVYRGEVPVTGARELVERMHRASLLVRYATNNSMFTRDAFAERLAGMGIPARAEEVATSTWATIGHLRRTAPNVHRVMAVGAAGMVSELRSAGFEIVGATRDGPPPDAVVVGLDPDFTDARCNAAAAAVRAGARFLATNADARYPLPDGFRPGAGTMVRAIADAAGQDPLIIGKPAPAMFAAILAATGVAASQAAVVGDYPDADVVAARRAGMTSILVLTGVTAATDVAGLAGERAPDVVAADPDEVWAYLATRIRG